MPSHRPDFVSVVVVDTGRFEETLASVESVERGEWPRDMLEILVISGPAESGRSDRLPTLGGRARVVRTESATSVTTAMNLGAAQARGQYVAFLGAGHEAESGWIRSAVRTFHAGVQIGSVASRITPRHGVGDARKVPRSPSVPTEGDQPKDILFGDRAAFFVRSSVFEEVGGFDERLAEAYDDVDLGWRINLFGYRVRFAPSSEVHRPARAELSDDTFSRKTVLERNALIVLYKNLDQENLGGFLAGALGLAALDTGVLAGMHGIERFISVLGDVAKDRERIQLLRTARDVAVLPLFGTSGISFGLGDSARPGSREIADALGIETPHGRIRVLVITGDLIGPRMAGPAIRAWNMCEQLAFRNDVRLVSPMKPTRGSAAFRVFHAPDDRAIREHEEWADVIVFQGYVLHQFRSLARSEKIMVADIYDPLHLEQLEQARDTQFEDWNTHIVLASEVLNEQLARADFLICASEKQRDFWLGQLAAVGRVNAMTYEADNSLRDLLAVAPFGLDPEVPAQQRHAIKGTIPGIGPDDKVLIWGGGIYDWFDTATLLRAMAKVVVTHPDARLFFLGVAHPNPGVPTMKAHALTFELSDELGLTDKFVFFNREWVAFDDRHNYLLDADAGVSTHYEHIETAFSFRTRILDYLWARLPMVTTRGDGFAELIDTSPLGMTVPERDIDALADAIISVLYDDDVRDRIAGAIDEVRDQFAWMHALEPLTAFCAAPRFAPDRNRSTHGHVMRMPDPVAAAIRLHHRGVGKGIRLAHHYLVREGPVGLTRRMRARLGL